MTDLDTNPQVYEFSGLATVYEVPCGDGRTIADGAFDHQIGAKVPLVWQHGHSQLGNVLGHGYLARSEEPRGIRIYAVLNETEAGQNARALIQHGDVDALSIYANGLDERNGRVKRGEIREVSVALAGMNPRARIDDVVFHADGNLSDSMVLEDAAIIHTGMKIELYHAETEESESSDEDETLGDIVRGFNDDQMNLLAYVMAHAADGQVESSGEESGGPTLQEIWDTMDDKQKETVSILAENFRDATGDSELAQSADHEGEHMTIKTNIFQNDDQAELSPGLAEMRQTAEKALAHAVQHGGSWKTAALQHGITNISNLFPEPTNAMPGNRPAWLNDPTEWVDDVLRGVRKVPFSFLKSLYADLTPDAARAKGYVTGDQKVEEVFEVLLRTTYPQTIYKKQSLDRDHVIDITDFDVIMWMKEEMKMKLQEEIARAILVGDGRPAGPEKINVTNVRPIWGDDAVYTIYGDLAVAAPVEDRIPGTGADPLAIIDYCVHARTKYRGKGMVVGYFTPEFIAKAMTVRDTQDRRIFQTMAELAAAMRVTRIVEVHAMSGLTRIDGASSVIELHGIIVNLKDYTKGATKGGEATMFDDFDIDFNQMKYLIETRMSGALMHPKSAIAVEQFVTDNEV